MKICYVILLVNMVEAIIIGKVNNITLHATGDKTPITQRNSCDSCLCDAFSSNNTSFIALNCFGNGILCELFDHSITGFSTSSNSNSTFYFYPDFFPMTIQTTTITPLIRWNSTGTTIAGNSNGVRGTGSETLHCPYSLTFDNNFSLYVTDHYNDRIQKFVIGESNGSTVAGLPNGTSGNSMTALRQPVGIAVDFDKTIYFTDRGNDRLMYWKNGAQNGTVIAGGKGNANDQLNHPSDLIRNHKTGTIYVADTFNHRIMRYLANATSGTVVAGGNGAVNNPNQLNRPYCFAFDPLSNSFLISNYGAHTIVRWVLNASTWTLVVGTPGVLGATSTQLRLPLSVVLDRFENMYVTDSDNHRVQFFLAGQSNGTTIAGVTGVSGIGANTFQAPYWAIIDDQLNLYVADTYNHRIQRFQRL